MDNVALNAYFKDMKGDKEVYDWDFKIYLNPNCEGEPFYHRHLDKASGPFEDGKFGATIPGRGYFEMKNDVCTEISIYGNYGLVSGKMTWKDSCNNNLNFF